MSTQLKMFDGVQGNTLGEYSDLDRRSDSRTSGRLETPSELEEVLESIEGLEPFPEVQLSDQRSNDSLLPPKSRNVRIISEMHVSDSHPNPYDETNNASVWARIRAFFLKGFPE